MCAHLGVGIDFENRRLNIGAPLMICVKVVYEVCNQVASRVVADDVCGIVGRRKIVVVLMEVLF